MTAYNDSLAATRATDRAASPARSGSANGRSSSRLGQGGAEFRSKRSVIALDALGPADQDMVAAGDAMVRQQCPGEGAKPALHPVAGNRIADLAGNGDAETHGR